MVVNDECVILCKNYAVEQTLELGKAHCHAFCGNAKSAPA